MIYKISHVLDAEVSDSLFSEENFKKYLIPKLLEIFCVRDAEIRKLLLYYFADFADCFSNSELQLHILPEVNCISSLINENTLNLIFLLYW